MALAQQMSPPLGRGMIWLLQVGLSWTYSSHRVTCRCPGSTNNTGDTAEITPMPLCEFLLIINFPSARTVGAASVGSCPAPATPGPVSPWVAERHSCWFRQLVTHRGLCPPHPWLQRSPPCWVNDYPRPPWAAVGWVSFQAGLILGAASALLQPGLPMVCPGARAVLPHLPRAGCPLPHP